VEWTIQDWGAAGELVGGVAVVLSLLYVGFQVRLNTAERRSDSIQSITAGNRELALVYVNNNDAGVAWHKVLGGEELTDRELHIMSDALYAHLMLLEETYSKYQQGYLDDSFLDARVALIRQKILLSPRLTGVYARMKKLRIYSQPFIEWLDSELRSSELYDGDEHRS
jgi:hypothetical protein